MYGTNPLYLADNRLLGAQLPPMTYKKPSPLEKIELPDDVEFVQQLNKDGNTVIVLVRIQGQLRLLKTFPERILEDASNPMDPSDPDAEYSIPVDRFEQVTEAYAHLLHYGIYAKGIVPHCHGWLELSQQHCERIAAIPELSELDSVALMLSNVDEAPRAILIEYVPDAVRLSHENITEALADKVLRTLCEIHAAYVMHGDVHRRNILVLPGDRIVWVDFNFSWTPSSKLTCRRQEFLEELYSGWSMLYHQMLPDKRIGFCQWFE